MFAKSPFKPLVSHIDKVNECVNLIKPLFETYQSKDYGKVEGKSFWAYLDSVSEK